MAHDGFTRGDSLATLAHYALESHIASHGVTPAEVEEVFANEPFDLSYDEMDGECRWGVLGYPGETQTALQLSEVVWSD